MIMSNNSKDDNKVRILFWNTNNNKQINPFLASIIYDQKSDIVILAEYSADIYELNKMFRYHHQIFIPCMSEGCDRIKILTSYRDIEPGVQDKYYSIQIIDSKLVLCGIHLQSNLHGDYGKERKVKIQQVVHDIKEIESKIGTRYSMIVGDLNEMPFEGGCIDADGLHGLPVFDEESNIERTVAGISFRKFYNPMWNFLGDFEYPPGTYYYNNSQINSPLWYMYDQFVMSYELAPKLNKEGLRIITSCRIGDLTDPRGRPNHCISDHFPIVCELSDL